jgi:hypothetical protein
LTNLPQHSESANTARQGHSRIAVWALLLASAGIPLSLLWDFSWENTVGVDLVWSAPHTANYLAVALAGLTALAFVLATTRRIAARANGVRLGGFHAPLGVWLSVWGALAFMTAVLFDRWWQSSYGMSAGIWHPPQILKAVAFFAVATGAWLFGLNHQNQPRGERTRGGGLAFVIGGGVVLALITVATLTLVYPNRQHAATFYEVGCGTYPIVLVALAKVGTLDRPATVASAVYMLIVCSMVWLLPLFPARPQVPPIYNPLDHLMPPPFPLLLIAPAVALDMLLRMIPSPALRSRPWLQAVAAGLVFFVVFSATQWLFAEFLLDDQADNWFFAGGGRHWPFFLKIDQPSRVAFWTFDKDPVNLTSAVVAAGLAVIASRIGLWIGAWMTRMRR